MRFCLRELARRLLSISDVNDRNGTKEEDAMSQRESNLLWLKDMLEHMTACQQQLAWAQDDESVQVLTDSILRDLESCRRLCEGMKRRSTLQHV